MFCIQKHNPKIQQCCMTVLAIQQQLYICMCVCVYTYIYTHIYRRVQAGLPCMHSKERWQGNPAAQKCFLWQVFIQSTTSLSYSGTVVGTAGVSTSYSAQHRQHCWVSSNGRESTALRWVQQQWEWKQVSKTRLSHKT